MTQHRRQFLTSATAVSAASLLGGSASVMGAEGEYERIEANGQTIKIGSGETWANKLIDVGNRNKLTIVAKDSNWTIRNIGFSGTMADHSYFGVCDSGNGTSTMENIYFGEGDPSRAASDRPIQIWVDPDHSGHLDVRNVNFSQRGANGIYGSAPGYNGNGGTITIDSCYGHDNHHTSFRISDNGMVVKNSVSYKSGTRAANRNIWVWEGDYSGTATIKNCHCITNGEGQGVATHGDPSIDMQNVATDDGSGTTGNPDQFVPESCPKSAKAAASGGSTDGTDESEDNGTGGDDGYTVHPGTTLAENENALVFSGTHLTGDDIQQSKYSLEVSGSLVPSRRNNATVDDNLNFSEGDTSYNGTVTDWKDAWVFTGELTDLTVEGPAKVYLNGNEIDPSNYGNENSTGSENPQTGGSEQPTDDNDTNNSSSSGSDPNLGESSVFEDDGLSGLLNSLFSDDGVFNDLFGSLFN